MRKLYGRMFRPTLLSVILLLGMAGMAATSFAVLAAGQIRPLNQCGDACTLAGDCDDGDCPCRPLGGGYCTSVTLNNAKPAVPALAPVSH